MSVVLAYAQRGTVYMVTDSYVTTKYSKLSGAPENDLQIRKLDNGLLLAIAEFNVAGKIAIAHPEIFTLPEEGPLTCRHIVREIIPALIEILGDGEAFDEKEDFPDMKNVFLLAQGGEIFEISGDLSVRKYATYCSASKVSRYFYYPFMKIDPEGDINAQLIEVMKRSTDLLAYLKPPFYLIDSKALEFKRVEG